MSAPWSRAICATRAASALVESPQKATSTASSAAAVKLASTRSPTRPFTRASHSSRGFLPTLLMWAPASRSRLRPCRYLLGAMKVKFIGMIEGQG